MCAAKSNSDRVWKCLFLTAESFALLGFLYAATWIISYRFRSQNHIPWAADHISIRLERFCDQWMNPMLWSFIAALLILLLVSPFFMRSSLRPAAVKAWSIGALTLLGVGVILLLQWS
jgi:hypothetical protein